jgi:hypothetical protein
MRRPAAPPTPLVAVTPPPRPAPPPPSPPTVAPPVLEEIIVDSLPPLAKIYVDGVAVADTPEAIKVEKGKTKTIVLKKDGFVDQTETLDGKKSRKVLVRLERVKKRVATTDKAPPPIKLPVPPPAPTPDPPRAHAAPPHPPAPPKKRYVDPYERVDEPKKGSDVLNPY